MTTASVAGLSAIPRLPCGHQAGALSAPYLPRMCHARHQTADSCRAIQRAQMLAPFSADQTTVAFDGNETRSPLLKRVPNPCITWGSLAGKSG